MVLSPRIGKSQMTETKADTLLFTANFTKHGTKAWNKGAEQGFNTDGEYATG